MINRRIDPALDRRRLILFFAGLIVFYVAVLLSTQPVLNGGEAELNRFVIGVMLATTVGAILACVFGPGLIRFGMPSWWLLAAFLPAALVFLITLVAAPISDALTFHPEHVARDQGLSWTEVAEQVGMTVSGAWSRYRRARPPEPPRLGPMAASARRRT